MRAPLRVLPWLGALLLLPGCRKIADTFFVVNAETQEACTSEQGIAFAATEPGTDAFVYSVFFPLGQMGTDLPEGALDSEFRLRLFEVDVTDGGADLSRIQSAKVSLRRRGSEEIIRTLVEDSQPSQAFTRERLTLRAVEAASVPGLGRDEQVELVFEARGTLPFQPWTANIQVCAGLRSEVHFFHFLY